MKDWISFKERSPEDLEEVLISCIRSNKKEWGPTYLLATFVRHEFVPFYHDSFNTKKKFKVTHWMPLPHPPKEKNK